MCNYLQQQEAKVASHVSLITLKRRRSAIICNLKNNDNCHTDKTAYGIKRTNDAFVILHNASVFCSLAFWFLQPQRFLARVLLPGEKFTSEKTPIVGRVWNDTILKCRKQWLLTLHHFILLKSTSAIHYVIVCMYLPHLHTEQEWGSNTPSRKKKRRKAMPGKTPPFHAMYIHTLKH